MGQTSSTTRAVEKRNSHPERGNSQESGSSPIPSTRRRQPTKRRSAVRRSIANFVKPASRDNSPAGTSGITAGKRRSWLKSRRWSKAPAEHVVQPEVEEMVAGQSEAAAGSATSGALIPAIGPKETDTTTAATSLAIPIPSPLEVQQHQEQNSSVSNSTEPLQHSDSITPGAGDPSSISQNREVMESSNAEHRSDSGLTESQSSSTANTDSPQNRAYEDVSLLASPADSESAREIPHTEERFLTPQEFVNEPESTHSLQPLPSSPQVPRAHTPTPTPTPTANPNSLPQNRPFPPPGTLVVVQGVVHTTDVPRPISTSPSFSPLSNSFPSNSDHDHDPQQTQSQSGSQLQSRSSEFGLGSRIRRSVSSASRPRSEIGSSARNRLSALFSGSRPGAIVSGSPSSPTSTMELDEATSTDTPTTSSSADASVSRVAADTSDTDPSVDVSSSSASSSAVGSSERADPESDTTTVVSQPSEGVSGSNAGQQTSRTDQSQPSSPSSGMISSSSIDVLGTLLSVAAAATAASLLTGSSDPILTPPISSPDAPRATSPSGTGFGADPFNGAVGSLGSLSGFGTGSPGIGASGPADRMRQAWGNIRERLGLRSNSSSVSLGSDLSADPSGDFIGGRDEDVPLLSDIDGRRSEVENATQRPEPRAPRDRMLAEMARAFQLGLGLNGPPIGGEHTNGPGSRTETSLGDPDPVGFGVGRTGIGELPPEGSFERFLVDLQTDLRAALGGGPQQQQQQGPDEQEQGPENDEQAVIRRQGNRENDIDELFRLIAEAEAEVRQRQRMIAERQAALRALVSGASAALAENASNNTQSSSSSPPSAADRRAGVETFPDSDEETCASLPMLEDVTDDSDSEDEAPVRTPVASTSGSRETERTEASLSRLSSMFDHQPSSARGVNSISEALNRRRAMGIGRTPPTLHVAETAGPAVLPPLEPPREVSIPLPMPSEQASTSNTIQLPNSPRVEVSLPEPDLTSLTSANDVASGTNAAGDTTRAAPTTLPTSEPSNNTTRSQAGSRNAIDDGTGRINWWRLYRFPPIATPPPRVTGQARGTNTATPMHVPTSSNPSPSPLQDSASLQPNVTSVAQSSTSSPTVPVTSSDSPQPSTPENGNQPQQAASNTVVPVIVVGLQSVNLAFFGPSAGPQQHVGNDTQATTATAPPLPVPTQNEEEVLSGPGGEQDDPTRENRQRRWQSRAAEALRTLRHGRNTSPRPPSGLLPDMLDGPGSRTFLIYVIGGYYPPDHNIVTGDPDTLDSFEALLDLADLLGQVRPPTASKEDIERSGLEVIKAPQVPKYEQEGKISSNCTERCLICLDEYQAEDDVRVLTCKHAFHMNCVDKWLQEGKNNCPACRGTGVVTSP
ncbi:hypothetical protein E1B28_012685 [Marasmius oreades]|uniref:RING-type domain-containing protein n=1 Tax=Marasmius oreades TaxID=181124 RepID=A0A9P7RSM0_9AGAR|nr:uncharacterized protein E1B28_012685 [Marasmius oreades]KAG7088717.1 hypothetical protein E1B28_012685 [Marasmius oreades]